MILAAVFLSFRGDHDKNPKQCEYNPSNSHTATLAKLTQEVNING